MKKWRVLICLVSLVFLVMAVTACQESSAAKSSSFRGAIYKDKDGASLFFRTGGKRYEIESQQDLADMVGKTVTLSGTVIEKDGKPTIVVDSVKASSE